MSEEGTREYWCELFRALQEVHWKVIKERDAATGVLQELEWTCGVCPSCFAWTLGPHKDDCRLDAILNTGRPQRPEAPSEGDRWPSGANVGPRVPAEEPEAPSDSESTLTLDGHEITLDDLEKELAKAGVCQSEVRVSWASYDELLTEYLELARERLLANVLSLVGFLIAFIVLAVQVARALGRGY